MKVYSPTDIADILQIKIATLRKYSSLLEKYGYSIQRNSQGHRYYQDKDIITLRNIIKGKNSGVTLDKTVQNVVKLESSSNETNDTNSGELTNNSDIADLKELMQELIKRIDKKDEYIEQLIKQRDQQQEYIKNSLEERDQALMDHINKSLETQKLIAADQEDQEEKTEKKKQSFWKRLFK